MEQNALKKNLTETVIVVGVTLSAMSFNSTKIVEYYNSHYAKTGIYAEALNASAMVKLNEANNIYSSKDNRLDRESKELFGLMRDATPGELASVSNYIKSISKKTGVNFFDLC